MLARSVLPAPYGYWSNVTSIEAAALSSSSSWAISSPSGQTWIREQPAAAYRPSRSAQCSGVPTHTRSRSSPGSRLTSGASTSTSTRSASAGSSVTHVHIVATGKDQAVFEAAAALAEALTGRGVDVIYDDRPKVSPGVKFKDAELIGVPTIVTVGRGLADGTVEVKDRRSGAREEVPVAAAADHLVDVVRG